MALVAFTLPAMAQDSIARAANTGFANMPSVRVVPTIAGVCGADHRVNDRVAYCTSGSVILVAQDQLGRPELPYLVAHAFGHAVQVKHGVADVALRTIRARRSEEIKLRGWVDRQVDCIAGFLYQRAGFGPASLTAWLKSDPFDDIHWGREPLSVGPVMPVTLADRDRWFQTGQTGDLAACSVGEFGSDLLIAAYRG